MTLKQLEYLMKIVEVGSITRAAQELYISQPSLTKAIAALEEEYGIQILVRKARGVELTPKGRDFVHYARGVLFAVATLDRNSIGYAPPGRRLNIATQQLEFINDLMVEAYRLNAGEDLCYNLVETDRDDVVRQVLDGRADLGFAVRTQMDSRDYLWNSENGRLDIRTITRGGSYLAMGPHAALYNRDHASFEEVRKQPQAVLDLESAGKESLWVDRQHYTFFNRNHLVFFNTVGACQEFLLDTDAVCFVSQWTRGCFKDPRIHILQISGPGDEQELVWTKRAGEPLNGTEAYFLQRIYQRLGSPVPEEIHRAVPAAELH